MERLVIEAKVIFKVHQADLQERPICLKFQKKKVSIALKDNLYQKDKKVKSEKNLNILLKNLHKK